MNLTKLLFPLLYGLRIDWAVFATRANNTLMPAPYLLWLGATLVLDTRILLLADRNTLH